MIKSNQIKEIQKRLPDDIKVVDETKYEFTEDEFLSILCWIKFFNHHYDNYGKTHYPFILFPIISKRLRLDFGLYGVRSECEPLKGNYNIYISDNIKNTKGRKTLVNFINQWGL